jgi:hypothetical protein
MNFDSINASLSGAPLWEGIKRDVAHACELALGMAPFPIATADTTSRIEQVAALHRAGNTYPQIAAAIGIPVGSVAWFVHKARRSGIKCGARRPNYFSREARAARGER